MATTIQFIENPPFIIDFKDFPSSKAEKNKPQENGSLVKRTYTFTKNLFLTLGASTYENLSYAKISFKLIVLGYYGSSKNWNPTLNIPTLLLRTVVWISSIALNIILKTMSFYKKKDQENEVSLYMSSEINHNHLQIKNVALDASPVPSEIQIDDLAILFQNINFNNPDEPGYMPPLSRTEENVCYTPAELLISLQRYIDHVKNRTPTTGTPPAHDVPRLCAFYQQIEDGARLTLHKTMNDLATFKSEYGEPPYEGSLLNTYKNLLEDQSRFVLSLAIAGKHCGARFMGETMDGYFSLCKNELEEENLKDAISNILANKRKEIALQCIQTDLGTDTHNFGMYMGALGKTLGIPGAANMIEHLSTNLDRNKCLTSFFSIYNVALIITTLKAYFQKSQLFREKIMDWLVCQSLDWNKPHFTEAAGIKSTRIVQLLNEDIVIERKENEIVVQFLALIRNLKEQGITLPSFNEGIDNFLQELLILDEVKKRVPVLERNKTKNQWLILLKHSANKENILAFINEGVEVPEECIDQIIIESKKIGKLREELQEICLDTEVFFNICRQAVNVEELLESRYEQLKFHAFLEAMNFQEFVASGATPAFIEWLLVSQEILWPQNEEPNEEVI